MSFVAPALTGHKPEQYAQLAQQLALLFGDERDFTANMANMAALIFHQLPDLNWAGFYLMKGGELVLGPFQGKPACIRIPLGRGVCGTAAARRETQLVPDVHAFPGHIACDADSRSEIVVPLIADGMLVGVLDLDSPKPGRFDEADRAGLEAAARQLLSASDLGQSGFRPAGGRCLTSPV
jgi:GAF domain-containing protein